MRVWRLVDKEFVADAWTGQGARIYGGRWNAPGTAVVYCSEQPALAVLEVLAGGLKAQDLQHWVLFSADVPDAQITALPAGATECVQAAAWLASGRLGCRVPSRVVPGNNILLNPAAKTWNQVKLHGQTPIDPRLWS